MERWSEAETRNAGTGELCSPLRCERPPEGGFYFGGIKMDLFGTPFERGTIVSVTDEGARVASTERPGIVTMPLKPLFRKAMEVGWPVFFMEYEDGSGLIISHQNPEVTREEIGAIVTKTAVEAVLTGDIATHNHTLNHMGAAAANHNHDAAYAVIGHNHAKANITDFAHTHTPAEAGAAPAVHNHDASYLGIGAKAADADKLDGYDNTAFPAYKGWISNPGKDANVLGNSIDFSYGNNAPWTGPLVTFSPGGYELQLSASYQNSTEFSFRTRNGDNGIFNPWRRIFHNGDVIPAANGGTGRTDGRAYSLMANGNHINFNWAGQGGQPPWLWGGSDGVNMYVYNPSNFNVSGAAWLNGNSTLVYGMNALNYFNGWNGAGNGADNFAPYGEWWHTIRLNHGNSAGYVVDLKFPFHQDGNIHYRRIASGGDNGWVRLYDNKNITKGTAAPSGGADGDLYIQYI